MNDLFNSGKEVLLDSKLRPVLRELNSSSQHIQASAVISRDGFVLSAMLERDMDADRLSAMSSSLLGLAETTSIEFKKGKLKQVLIEGEYGYILSVEVGNNAVLSIIAHTGVNLGMVFVEARRTVSNIMNLLRE